MAVIPTDAHGWPFAEGTGQIVTEHDWETMARTWQEGGVVGYPEGASPSSGNRGLYAVRVNNTRVQIQPGVACIAGHYFELKLPLAFDLDITGSEWPGNGGTTREDLIVLRLNRDESRFEFVQLKNAVDPDNETMELESEEEIPLVQLTITDGVGIEADPIDRRWFISRRVRPIQGSDAYMDPPPANGELGVDVANNYLVVGRNGEWVPASQVFNNDGAGGIAELEDRVDAIEEALEDVAGPQTLTYSISGRLEVGTGTFRIYNDTGRTWTILAVRVTVGTAPTGGSTGVRVDVNKNGSSIFGSSSAQPTIAPGTNTAKVTSFATDTVADGDYLTVDVDNVGSTNPGEDLVVQVVVK